MGRKAGQCKVVPLLQIILKDDISQNCMFTSSLKFDSDPPRFEIGPSSVDASEGYLLDSSAPWHIAITYQVLTNRCK